MAGLGLHSACALDPWPQRSPANHDPLSAQRCHKGLPVTRAPWHSSGIRSEVWLCLSYGVALQMEDDKGARKSHTVGLRLC